MGHGQVDRHVESQDQTLETIRHTLLVSISKTATYRAVLPIIQYVTVISFFPQRLFTHNNL